MQISRDKKSAFICGNLRLRFFSDHTLDDAHIALDAIT